MKGFKEFLLRGNVVDLAVAVVIGAAFGSVVTAFVAAFLTPLIGVAAGATGDISKISFTVSGVKFQYGLFLNALIAFVLIAAVVYFVVVLPVQKLMERRKTEPAPEAEVRDCPECVSKIPVAATRCAFCTVELASA